MTRRELSGWSCVEEVGLQRPGGAAEIDKRRCADNERWPTEAELEDIRLGAPGWASVSSKTEVQCTELSQRSQTQKQQSSYCFE